MSALKNLGNKKNVIAKKVARKANPRNEEKYNEKNRQAQSFQEILLSQSTSVGQNGKKVDLLL